MKILGMIAVSLSAVLLAAGCTRVVDGSVHPAPGLPPHPLTGPTAKKALLDNAQLSKLLGQPFKGDPDFPPRFGGSDQLFDIDAAPRECAEVVFELQKSAYRSAGVKDVAQESWWSAGGRRAKVISVAEAVVAMTNNNNADALFAQFSQQWTRCAGTTVTDYNLRGEPFSTAAISDVRTADSVLAATVRSRVVTTVTHARSLGVRVNCLVEVNVAFFSNRPDDSAIDIAHAMMDKVSDLS